MTLGLPHARAVIRTDRLRQSKKPGAAAARWETAYHICSQRPEERSGGQWEKLGRGQWGVENPNHWRRDACLLEDLKTYRGKRHNICAAFLLGRTVLLAFNADWGSGNLNALLEELRASPASVCSLAVRGTTTNRHLPPRASSRKPASK